MLAVSNNGATVLVMACFRFRVTMPSGFEESLRGIVSRRLIELFRATSPVRVVTVGEHLAAG